MQQKEPEQLEPPHFAWPKMSSPLSPQDQEEPAEQLAVTQPLADAQEAHREVTALQDTGDSATLSTELEVTAQTH